MFLTVNYLYLLLSPNFQCYCFFFRCRIRIMKGHMSNQISFVAEGARAFWAFVCFFLPADRYNATICFCVCHFQCCCYCDFFVYCATKTSSFFQKIVNFANFLLADDLSSKLMRITVFESHQKCLRFHNKKQS